jgi:hypothetical protein
MIGYSTTPPPLSSVACLPRSCFKPSFPGMVLDDIVYYSSGLKTPGRIMRASPTGGGKSGIDLGNCYRAFIGSPDIPVTIVKYEIDLDACNWVPS